MNVKKIALAGLITASMFGSVKAQSIEKHIATNEFPNTVRVSNYEQINDGLDNFSFIDITKDGYFARTRTKKKVLDNLSARLETKHGIDFIDKASIGVNYNFDVGGTDMNAYVLPAWFNRKGFIDNSTIAGVSLSKDFEYNLFGEDMQGNVFAFGEYNLPGNQWDYGEAQFYNNKKGSDLSIGLGAKFTGKGGVLPKVNPQIMLKYNF